LIYSPTCQYALRALIYLAGHESGGPALGTDIAKEEGIPEQFLSKILHTLRNKGLVVTTKGPGGGYHIARSAEKITINDVVEAIDGKIDLNNVCVLGLDRCSDMEGCALHQHWKQFRKEYIEVISTMNLKQAASTVERKRHQ
jgi:Rrf2 family iron-sulfur cluster assembly transcriptional regulator